MKPILILLIVLTPALFVADSFYNLSFTSIGGAPISFSGFQGKRVVVIPFNGAQPDWGMLITLDSLQKLHPDSLAVLAFPAMDFDSTFTASALSHVHDSLGLGLMLAQPGYVTKTAGAAQQTAFQWLTNMARNTHFNRDVDTVGQLFIISPKGTLYSVIDKSSYAQLLPTILGQTVPGE